MTEWREFKIKDIADVVGGGTPSTAINEYWNGDIPWLTPKDLTGYIRNFISHGERFITKKGLENSSARLLPKGTVLLTSRAPIGYVAIAENEICTNQGFKSLVPNPDKAHNLFLLYWIKSNVEYLQSIGTGTTFQEISGSVLKDVDIILPPLPEQKAIAEVLSSLDDKIDLLTRQNKTLEDLAQAYFRKWFIEDIHNKICYKRFADVAEFSKGKKPREIIEEQRKGYVRQILIDTFDTDKEYYTRPEGMIISTETDILMVMDGASSGRVEIGFSGVVGSTIGMFRPKSDFKYPMFLYEFLKSNEEFIMDNTTGSAIPHADKKLIFELEIPYFQEEKIQEFENFALVLFNKRQNNRRQIRTLTKLRDTLLPKLISGEIRVKM